MKHVTFTFRNHLFAPFLVHNMPFVRHQATHSPVAQSRNKDRMRISGANRASSRNPQNPKYFQTVQLAQFRNEDCIKICTKSVDSSATRTNKTTSKLDPHRITQLPNRSRTIAIASSRVWIAPSSCASSTACRISLKRGPGSYPAAISSRPVSSGSGRTTSSGIASYRSRTKFQ